MICSIPALGVRLKVKDQVKFEVRFRLGDCGWVRIITLYFFLISWEFTNMLETNVIVSKHW